MVDGYGRGDGPWQRRSHESPIYCVALTVFLTICANAMTEGWPLGCEVS